MSLNPSLLSSYIAERFRQRKADPWSEAGNREASAALDARTFILGVGAQKAGTTWLRRYFFESSEILMSRIGELHFFDALWREDFRQETNGHFILRLQQLAAGLSVDKARPNPNEMYRLKALVDRLDMIEGGLASYRRFFANRLAPEHTHFGDITPSYAVLPVEAFRQIKAMHPKTKVVFLMRDPVDRLSSALRMVEAESGIGDRERCFDEVLVDPGFAERTRYEVTVKRLRSVFDEDAIFFGFYESLFCDASMKALCDFLELPFRKGDYGQRVNEGTRIAPLSPSETARARAAFAETYDFCRLTFGQTVPASWL